MSEDEFKAWRDGTPTLAQAERVWHRKDCPFCGSPDGQYSASLQDLPAAFFCKGCGINAAQPPAAPVGMDWKLSEDAKQTIAEIDRNIREAPASIARHNGLSAGNAVVNGLGWMETEVDRGDGTSEFAGFEAETPFGTFYAIEIHGDAFTVEYDLTKIGEADTPDEAKRIGQRDFEQRIRTALVPDEPQTSGVWQPIESAPKDGTDVLVWCREGLDIARYSDRKEDAPDDMGHDAGWWGVCQPMDPGRSMGTPAYTREPENQPWAWMPQPEPPYDDEGEPLFSSPLTRPESK